MTGFYTTIARYYDAENDDKTDDLLLYTDLAEEYGSPILDIGCGTGRVMMHLAQEGCEVHGIERDGAMLERAQHKRAALPHLRSKLMFHQGDVLRYEFKQRFKLVLLTYNMLTHFHEQDVQLNLLRRMHDLVEPGGLLVIDVPNAGNVFASEDTDAVTLERTFIDPESGHLVMQQSVSTLDRAEQLLHVTWIYDEVTEDGTVKRTFAPVIFRYFFLSEIRLLLALTGFEVDAVYGDYEGGEYVDGCERLIVLAKPRP
ncbi:MAG: class I SAM-dependent methyltransferase [Anaerolineae bacterium]